MNNFVTRVITATIFGALCLAGIYFNGAIHLLFLLFSVLALKEFYGLIFFISATRSFVRQLSVNNTIHLHFAPELKILSDE